jgi:hypothetical protein
VVDELNRLLRVFVGHVIRPTNLSGYTNCPQSFACTIVFNLLSLTDRAISATHPLPPSPHHSPPGHHRWPLPAAQCMPPAASSSSCLMAPWPSRYPPTMRAPGAGCSTTRLQLPNLAPLDSGRPTPSPLPQLWQPYFGAKRWPSPPTSFKFTVSAPDPGRPTPAPPSYMKMFVLILIE